MEQPPIAVLSVPDVLLLKEHIPTATLLVPVVLLLNAKNPTAVFADAVLQYKAFLPIATLLSPA